MRLIIASREDSASSSIAERLLDRVDFSQTDSKGVLIHGEFLFGFIEKRHLFMDNLDGQFQKFQKDVDEVIFLSRHSSAANIKSITVHPTGNFHEAVLGGVVGRLSPTAPEDMTSALMEIHDRYNGNEFSVTYEATHHGPALDIPHFYMEIGTTADQWENPEAQDLIIDGIFAPRRSFAGTFVGIGGGHYMPKITQYSLENGVAMGHMISKHSLLHADRSIIEQSVQKTPGCRGFIVDRKGVKSETRVIVESVADSLGLELLKI